MSRFISITQARDAAGLRGIPGPWTEAAKSGALSSDCTRCNAVRTTITSNYRHHSNNSMKGIHTCCSRTA
jgi:hypothetical protein